MSYQINYSFGSYTSSINAKIFDATGAQVGATITNGFVSLGNNQYSYLATIPDGQIGTIVFYDSANPTAACTYSINPGEAENNDSKTSAVKSDTGGIVTTLGTAGAGLTAVASATNLATANTNISAINTKLGTPAGASVSADVAAIKNDTGTVGVVISTATMRLIADELLKRSVSNVEASASTHSLAEVILGMFESAAPSTTWTIYRTDHSTVFNTHTLTTDAAAVPVTGVN